MWSPVNVTSLPPAYPIRTVEYDKKLYSLLLYNTASDRSYDDKKRSSAFSIFSVLLDPVPHPPLLAEILGFYRLKKVVRSSKFIWTPGAQLHS
jgi:hypothetical protein